MADRFEFPKMQREDWWGVKGFTADEAWGDPYKMDKILVYRLSALRKFIRDRLNKEARIIVHCGYEERERGGYHPRGMAVDCHCTNISLVDFYLAAERFQFGGIGVYPNWNNPGLHLDVRVIEQDEPAHRWGCNKAKPSGLAEYCSLDSKYLRACITLLS